MRSRSHAAVASAQSCVERTGDVVGVAEFETVGDAVAEFEPVGDAVTDCVSDGVGVTDGVSDGVGDDDTGDALDEGVLVRDGKGGSAAATIARGVPSSEVAPRVENEGCDQMYVVTSRIKPSKVANTGAHVIWTRNGPLVSFIKSEFWRCLALVLYFHRMWREHHDHDP